MSTITRQRTTPEGRTHIYIINVTLIHSKLHSGDKPRPDNILETSLSTLKATLALPTDHEHRKLPKDTTTQTQVVHTSWHKNTDHESLSITKHSNYETITTHISLKRGSNKIQEATYNEDTYTIPSETIHTPCVLEIQCHKHLSNQATYLLTRWSPEMLSQ